MSNIIPNNTTAAIIPVQVALRIRPLSAEELVNIPSQLQKNAISTSPFTPNQVVIQGEKKRSFTFDHVFGADTTQKEIYDKTVMKLVHQFLEGNNVTLVTFGHKSSGKTYTIGTNNSSLTQESKGIIPRSMVTLLSCVNSAQYKTRKFSMKISIVEIYNDKVIDLLCEGGDKKAKDSDHVLTGLQEIKVNSAEEVIGLLSLGQFNRRANAQARNQNDPNSHVIVTATLSQLKFIPSNESSTSPTSNTPPATPSKLFSPKFSRSKSRDDYKQFEGDWVKVTSKFHFVDLAGNEMEKGNFGLEDKLKEHFSSTNETTTKVVIGNVICALEEDPSQTTLLSYKDNKLTKILQNYLGKNSQILIIACVSPAGYNIKETTNTLEYAKYARNMKYTSFKNIYQEVVVDDDDDDNENDLEHLQNVISKLRSEIKELKNDPGPGLISSLTSSVQIHNAPSNSEDKLILLKRSFNDLSKEFVKSKVLNSTTTIPEEEISEKPHDTSRSEEDSDDDNSNNIQHAWPSFQKAVGPVIQEYEKSISSLENQLSVVRAALSHSESKIHNQEHKLCEAEENNEKNINIINNLKHQISKLYERGETTGNYIKDLEAKLNSDAYERKKDQTIINDLKSRMEELLKNEGSNVKNSKLSKVDLQLEKDLKDTKDKYLALIQQFDKQKNADREEKDSILEEVRARDNRILQLEKTIENLIEESNHSKSSSTSSTDTHFFTSSPSSSISTLESHDIITSLQEKLSDVQTQFEDTKTSQFKVIKEMETKLNKANDALTQKEDKLMKQDLKINELEAFIQKSSVELRKAQTSEMETKKRIKELESKITKSVKENVEETTGKQSARIKELEELLSKSRQEPSTAESARINELEAKLEEKNINENELQQFIEFSNVELMKLQKSENNHIELITELESKLQELEDQRVEEISKLDGLESENSRLLNEIELLKKKIKDPSVQATRGINATRNLSADKDKVEHENTIAQQNDLIKDLQNRISELEQSFDEPYRNTSVGRDNKRYKKHASHPMPNTHKDSSQVAELMAEIQNLKKKLSKAESENLKNKPLVTTFNENELQNTKEQLNSVLSQNQDLLKHVDELKSVLEEARNEIENTKTAKEKSDKSRMALESRIEKLMGKKNNNKFMCF